MLEDDDEAAESPAMETSEHATGAEAPDEDLEIGAMPMQKGMQQPVDDMAAVRAESDAIRQQHQRARIASVIAAHRDAAGR
jgi:hypothetical protein